MSSFPQWNDSRRPNTTPLHAQSVAHGKSARLPTTDSSTAFGGTPSGKRNPLRCYTGPRRRTEMAVLLDVGVFRSVVAMCVGFCSPCWRRLLHQRLFCPTLVHSSELTDSSIAILGGAIGARMSIRTLCFGMAARWTGNVSPSCCRFLEVPSG